ncbi:KR domain-containing protein, partial [Rhizomonospora bruguierae]|uniref:KR domain-containing protein n=1 Tax=Rhizomonospora bruguierae TaxID=1581705 RepID=UPI001BCE0D88
HSVGEIAAAHVAGVLSLPDAVRLVAARGRLMQALPAGGAMVALRAREEEIQGVDIAAVNGPDSFVISGAEADVLAVAAQFERSTRLRVSHAFHSVLMEPMLDDFATVVEGLTFNPPTIPIVSTVGTDTAMDTPEYWVRQVRATVRYADAIDTARSEGVTRILEVGPDAILTPLTEGAVPAARREQSETETLIGAVAQLHTTGQRVDWAAVLPKANVVDLPTYPFQHQRYWLDASPSGGDPKSAGLLGADHPLLAAAIPAPDSDAVTFTGRLTAAAHGWILDHEVHGSVLLPGTGFVELALWAGRRAGCPAVAELTLRVPLLLPENGAVALQVVLDAAGGDERRRLRIYSRPEGGEHEAWTLHADGVLTADAPAAGTAGPAQWPPADATPVAVDGVYDTLADYGFGYGPAFQGLRAAWRRGEELFAEVELPHEAAADAARYGLHPALLDAAMHALGLGGPGTADADGTQTRVPFSWGGVVLHAPGAPAVRVWLSPAAGHRDAIRLELTDGAGAPVASVAELLLRPISAAQLNGAGQDDLFRIEWRPLPAGSAKAVDWVAWADLPADGPVPAAVVLRCAPAGGQDPLGAAHAVTGEVLGRLQEWLADARYAGSRLVLAARAVPAVWGLVRAAEAENPGRFVLVDIDEEETSWAVLGRALASGEPELAVRDGDVTVPRLVRAPAPTGEEVSPWAGDGTVLVTGGTGGLGALLARHLVAVHGVRSLVLTSRRGLSAPGAADLRDELTELGAVVRVEACDVSRRPAVAALLAGIADLVGVVHAAGVGGSGLIGALTPERLAAAYGPKADGAWHLHELTRDRGLRAFVLLSSAGGLVMPGGQGGYAAANVFLDGLAELRRAQGLPAVSLAYGLWGVPTGLSGMLSEADIQRMAHSGLPVLSGADGLRLFDAGVLAGDGLRVPLKVDVAALRAAGGDLPALLRGLVPRIRRRAAAGGGAGALRQRLAGLSDDERAELILGTVLTCAAQVLGHEDAAAVNADHGFLESGFDSLTALELRNLLNTATGLNLGAMVVFDSKNPSELARLIAAELAARPAGGTVDVLSAAPAAPVAPAAERREESLYELFIGAINAGTTMKGMALLQAVAQLRPTFASPADLPALPEPVRFKTRPERQDGVRRPRLICLSTPTVAGGVHQHARLAAVLAAPVTALPTPGFARGEQLPVSFDSVVHVLADAVLAAAQGEPFVLYGFSSGGLLAHAVTTYLGRERGVRPAGLIMVDTYRIDSPINQAIFDSMAFAVEEKAATMGEFSNAELSAMGRYVDLLPTFQAAEIDVPLLFVQARDLFTIDGRPAIEGDAWRATWAAADAVRVVPGTHFTIAEQDAATTARAVDDWLATLPA